MQHAVAANVYQFVNNAYESKGKLGVAIIGYFGKKEYKVIVYNNKKAQLMQATLFDGFQFTPQPGDYASIYDDVRKWWLGVSGVHAGSVMQESERVRWWFDPTSLVPG
jgi:hypothetical protein